VIEVAGESWDTVEKGAIRSSRSNPISDHGRAKVRQPAVREGSEGQRFGATSPEGALIVVLEKRLISGAACKHRRPLRRLLNTGSGDGSCGGLRPAASSGGGSVEVKCRILATSRHFRSFEVNVKVRRQGGEGKQSLVTLDRQATMDVPRPRSGHGQGNQVQVATTCPEGTLISAGRWEGAAPAARAPAAAPKQESGSGYCA